MLPITDKKKWYWLWFFLKSRWSLTACLLPPSCVCVFFDPRCSACYQSSASISTIGLLNRNPNPHLLSEIDVGSVLWGYI
uniref:Uncharacterized protein n=1 Tax=Anguilla anguilla TaxID=7936 RepID=A0A0E9WWX4_ANGAN